MKICKRFTYACWVLLASITIIQATNLEITSVAVTDVTSCQGYNNGSITISATGGNPPYLYSIDGGNIWQEDQTFTGLGVGCYNIEVQDSPQNYGTIVKYAENPVCIFQIPEPECLPANKLLDISTRSVGAPVQSVAWLCERCCPYKMVAVGGYKSDCTNSSLHVYQLDLCTDNLNEIMISNPLPTSCIYSVAWCCIEKIPYLAVGGAPDENTGNTVWIYKYNSTHGIMELVNSFSHGNTVFAVSWLCNVCLDKWSAYVAIGGQSCGGDEIRILKFDAHAQTFDQISSTSFGATVYSLDWCVQNCRCPLLAAGGRIAESHQHKHNIMVYAVSCAGGITPIEHSYYEGKTVRVLRWCCHCKIPFGGCPWLAVGGDPIMSECKHCTTIELFVFDPYKHCLKEFAHQEQPGKVFSLEWLPSCECSRLVVGSGCLEDPCKSNIIVYSVEQNCLPQLKELSKIRFDDSITSVDACTIFNITYFLAGYENNNWNKKIDDPLCQTCKKIKELALFKGKFCCAFPLPKPLCHHSKHGDHRALS